MGESQAVRPDNKKLHEMTPKETHRPCATMGLKPATRDNMLQMEATLKRARRIFFEAVQNYEFGSISEFKTDFKAKYHESVLLPHHRAITKLVAIGKEARMKAILAETEAEFKAELKREGKHRSKAFQLVFPDPKPAAGGTR